MLRPATVVVELRGEFTRGMTVPLWVAEPSAPAATGAVVVDVDVEAVLAHVVDAFEGMSRRSATG